MPARTSKNPLLCFLVSQDRPRVPQDAQMKPPSMPNDRFGYRKCLDPLATMSRNCNPRARSNGRGPAAKGVAHKINISFYETVDKSTCCAAKITEWNITCVWRYLGNGKKKAIITWRLKCANWSVHFTGCFEGQVYQVHTCARGKPGKLPELPGSGQGSLS